MKEFFDAAHSSVAAANRKLIEIAQKNLNAGIDLSRSLAGARNPIEFVQLLSSHYWKQVRELATQVEEVRYRLFGFSAVELQRLSESKRQQLPQNTMAAGEKPVDVEPIDFSAEAARSSARPSDERQLRSRKQSTPETRPKPRSPLPVHKVEQKPQGSKGKSRKHSSSSPVTRPGGRADRNGQPGTQVAAKRTGQTPSTDVKFGILDGNAVRFTDFEAWWLVNGAWRRISSEEALSNAAEMREARFNQRFPKLPRLPSKAFQTAKR